MEIPYWWDFSREKLEVTLYKARPELFDIPPAGEPIEPFPPGVQVGETDFLSTD